MPKYLRVLMGLGFISQEWPVTLKKNRDIRTGSIYALSDNFMKFWYTYVFPTRSILEINREAVISKIASSYDQYLGHVFEENDKEYLIDLNSIGKLPFAFERIGRQWGKVREKHKNVNAYEIDLVALNEDSGEILFAECKWQVLTDKSARKILQDLRNKSTFVQWKNEDRKEYFALVAKRIENKAELRDSGFMAFDIEDICADME
jgi:hypothetical protein